MNKTIQELEKKKSLTVLLNNWESLTKSNYEFTNEDVNVLYNTLNSALRDNSGSHYGQAKLNELGAKIKEYIFNENTNDNFKINALLPALYFSKTSEMYLKHAYLDEKSQIDCNSLYFVKAQVPDAIRTIDDLANGNNTEKNKKKLIDIVGDGNQIYGFSENISKTMFDVESGLKKIAKYMHSKKDNEYISRFYEELHDNMQDLLL